MDQDSFPEIVVCGSGFAGQARKDLRMLCASAGITYCGDLCKGWTTHLVLNTSGEQPSSEKVGKAAEWGIPTVSPDWLLHSIDKGAPLPVVRYQMRSKPGIKYGTPITTSLGEAAFTPNPERQALTPLDNIAAQLRRMSISPADKPAALNIFAARGTPMASSQPSPTLRGFLPYTLLRRAAAGSPGDAYSPATGSMASMNTESSKAATGEDASPSSAQSLSPESLSPESLPLPAQPPCSLRSQQGWSPDCGDSAGWIAGDGQDADKATAEPAGQDFQELQANSGDASSPDRCLSPGACAVLQRRRLHTGITQLPGPLVIARPRAPAPALPPDVKAAEAAVTAVNLLLRAPRGSLVKQRHRLTNLKGVEFADAVYLKASDLTLSTKDKKTALRIAGPGPGSSGDAELLVEAQSFYRLPGGPWRVEYLQYFAAAEAEELAAVAGRGLALPSGFDRRLERLRSTQRVVALLTDVTGTVAMRKVTARPGGATLRVHSVGGSSSSSYFWRAMFDPEGTAVVLE